MNSKTDYYFDSKAQRLLIKPSMIGNYPGSVLIQSKIDDSFKSLPFLITVNEKVKDDPSDQNGKDPGKKDDDKKPDQGETDKDQDESKKVEIKIEDILTGPEIEEIKTVTETEISDFLSVRH